MHRAFRFAPTLLALGLALTGCPRSRSDVAAPTADAGLPAVVGKRVAVTLDGRGSRAPDGWSGTLRYRWTQTGGAPVDLSDDGAAAPTFVAPGVSGPLTFSLVVTAERPSEPDTVTVTVRNQAPVADAGAAQTAQGAWLVSLDGSQSHDSDGDPLTYSWVQLTGPQVPLDALAMGWARFSAPNVLTTLTFLLVVSDGEASDEDQVEVVVDRFSTNQPPVADAGPDRIVTRGAFVSLAGMGQDPEGAPLAFTWEQVSGPSVLPIGPRYAVASFYAPMEYGDLEFAFTVSDGVFTARDTVVVHVANPPPTISSVTLSPAPPRTDDDLRAQVTAFDPEGEPVTLSYAWQVNGAAVAGQTGETFPASLTAKGDVVLVTVTASDGIASSTSSASITVVDSPATVHVVFPAEIRHGASATGQASAVDPDGDPVTPAPVELAYGPAGMTVGADGAISWTPTLPMFEGALDVRFGVRFTDGSGGLGEASVRVVDPARPQALRQAGLQRPLVAEALRARDLDGDGRDEVLVSGAGGVYVLRREALGFGVAWMAPFQLGGPLSGSSYDVASAVEAADLDGDGAAEIFYGERAILVRVDGVTRQEVARATAGTGDRWHACEAADLDLDGHLELACLVAVGGSSYGVEGRLVVLDAATLAVRFETASLAFGRSLAVGNVDGDAALEIVTSGGFVFDGVSHANEWAYAPGFGNQVEIGRPVAGQPVQIIGGVPLRGFSATLKTPLWESVDLVAAPFLVRDVDGDGADEFVSLPGYSSTLQAHRWVGGAAVLQQVFSAAMGISAWGAQALVAGDFDGDGVAEALWDGSGSTYGGVFTLAGPLSAQAAVTWQAANPAQLDGPMTGALPVRVGGGSVQVAFQSPRTNAGYDGARITLLDPATGAFSSSPVFGTNWARATGLAAADYDADGVDELFMATAETYDPYLLAWDPADGAVAWTSPRLSSSYSYNSFAGVAAADMDADGAPDLVALTGDGAIWIHDVRDQTLVWKSVSLGSATALAVADLDGDGRPEALAAAGGRVVSYGWLAGAGTFVEEAATSLPGVTDLAVGDCDGDGQPEVYALSASGYYGAASVTRLDAALQPLGSFSVTRASSVFVEELGPGRKNLALAVRETADVYGYGEGRDTLVAVDAVTGAEVWRSPPLFGAVSRDSASWLQQGGAWRLALGAGGSMYLTR